MDVRVGGTYRVVMILADGSKMTWRWEEDTPADEYDTLLTLEFRDRGGKTELTLTHEQFATAESRANHEHGWNAILDQLTGAL